MRARRREAYSAFIPIAGLVLWANACSSPHESDGESVGTSRDELSTWVAEPNLSEGAGTAPLIRLANDIALVVTDKNVSTYRHELAGWTRQTGTQAVGPCDELNGPAITHYSAANSGDVALVSENNIAGHFGPCVYLRSGNDFVAAQPLEADDETGNLTTQYAISGNAILIASAAGIAVYERTGGTFAHVQMLQTSDGLTGSKPFWLSGNDAIVQSGGALYAFERTELGWNETGVVDTSSTGVNTVALTAAWLLVQSGSNTGFYSKSDHVWSIEQVVASPRGVMDAGSDVAVIDSIVYEQIAGSWQRTFDLNPTQISTHYQPPFRRPVTSVAVWDGGVLLGINGHYMYDGLSFNVNGTVTPFVRYVEPETCTADSDCKSAHCVEGICCQTACSGTCVSCLASRKGSGIDGVCGYVVAGTDPRDSCSADEPDGCGQTGVCTAAGACEVQTDGTPCRGGYVCAEGACGTSCVDDSGCDTANYYFCVDGYCQVPTVIDPETGGAGGGASEQGGAAGEASEQGGAGGSSSDQGGAAGEPASPTAGSSGYAGTAGGASETGGSGGTRGSVPAHGLPRQRSRAGHHSHFGCALAAAPSHAVGWVTSLALLITARGGRRRFKRAPTTTRVCDGE